MPAKVRKWRTARNIEQDEYLVWYGGTIPRNPLSPPQTHSPVQPDVDGAFSGLKLDNTDYRSIRSAIARIRFRT
jgi:hypothetical protein